MITTAPDVHTHLPADLIEHLNSLTGDLLTGAMLQVVQLSPAERARLWGTYCAWRGQHVLGRQAVAPFTWAMPLDLIETLTGEAFTEGLTFDQLAAVALYHLTRLPVDDHAAALAELNRWQTAIVPTLHRPNHVTHPHENFIELHDMTVEPMPAPDGLALTAGPRLSVSMPGDLLADVLSPCRPLQPMQGESLPTYRVADAATGALLCMWADDPDVETPQDAGRWAVSWTDAEGMPGTGWRMVEGLLIHHGAEVAD